MACNQTAHHAAPESCKHVNKLSIAIKNAAFYRKASKVLLEVHVLSFYPTVVLSLPCWERSTEATCSSFCHRGYVDVARAFIVNKTTRRSLDGIKQKHLKFIQGHAHKLSHLGRLETLPDRKKEIFPISGIISSNLIWEAIPNRNPAG